MHVLRTAGVVVVAVVVVALGFKVAVDAVERLAPTAAEFAKMPRPELPALEEQPDPVTFTKTFAPPGREELAMAAKTGVSMGTTWNATLWADVYWPGGDPPVESVSLATLGGTARVYRYLTGNCEINSLGEINYMSPASPAADVQAAVEEWADGAPEGFAAYIIWAVAASAPGDSDYVLVANGWQGDIPPEDPVWAGPTEIEVAASITVSGLYLKRARTSSPPSSRQLMDFTDQALADTWWADESTSVTVSCGGASAQGALSYSDEEVEIGSSFIGTCTISLNNAPSANTTYARISDLQWGGTAVPLGNLDLYNPGAPAHIPSVDIDPWSRVWTTNNCWHVTDDGGIALQHMTGTASAGSVSPKVSAMRSLTVHPMDGQFDAEGPGYDVEYESIFLRWDWDDETEDYVSSYIAFTGQYSAAEFPTNWEYEYEYRKLAVLPVFVRVTDTWRTDNGEDVGGTTETQNDRRAAICACGLTASDCSSNPWWGSGFAFAIASSINVNDTYGLPSRASPWTGGAGVTIDPGDNDSWTVAAGVTSPVVSRSFATRYWLRLDRLSGGYVPGWEYNTSWPIMLKANIAIGTTGDDPDWWDSDAGGVDGEDIWNWANYRYIAIGLTAPRAGTVQIVVDYTVPSIYDPCYTGASYRFEEFSYSTSSYQLTFSADVTAGANSILIDKFLNVEQATPTGAQRTHVIDSVTFRLVGNTGATDDEWALTYLSLTLDPGEGVRAEPSSHMLMRFKPAWDWEYSNWFGFGGTVDGMDALEVDYGYSNYSHERKLLYIRHSQHNPDSQAEGRLDAAKGLGALYNELNWQEGFSATWPTPTPENNSDNMDADGNKVDSSLYWWDLWQSNETITQSNVEVALCAGTYNIAAGTPYTLEAYKYPRGVIHGIVTNPSRTAVLRSTADLVDCYESDDGGPYTLVDTASTDEHGRFMTAPVREQDRVYMLDAGGEQIVAIPVTNRSYTTRVVEALQLTPVEPTLADGYLTDLHLAFVSDGTVWHRQRKTISMPWSAPTSVVAGRYPCLIVPPDNCPVMCYQTPSSTVAWLRSTDHGATWESIGMATSGTYPVAAEANGIQYLVSYTSGVGQLVRRSQDYFSTILPFGSATSALVVGAGSTNAERVGFLKLDAAGRMLWTAVPFNNRVHHYGSYDDGATWVAL